MKVYPTAEVIDGAGVRIRRYIGTMHIKELDPFLLLDEIKSQDPKDYIKGFPEHPHRGFQTLTFMIKGSLLHTDSEGNQQVLKEMWLQWMNAGRGVVHSEMPLTEKGLLWGFQLWLNNPKEKKMSEPFYYSFPAVLSEESNLHRVWNLVGEPIKERGFYPLTCLFVELKRGAQFNLMPQEGQSSFIALSEGSLLINSARVDAPSLAVLEGNTLLSALKDASFLFGSARPLGEPVVRWGPFVMSSQEEIIQAIKEYREGRCKP